MYFDYICNFLLFLKYTVLFPTHVTLCLILSLNASAMYDAQILLDAQPSIGG